MAAAWRELGPRTRPDCVTFVPMPPERERQRGYNQARLLAQWVGEELELPVLPLLRREGVMMQHHLSAGARRKGVRKAYRLLPEGEDQVPGKRVLLVEDIELNREIAQVILEEAGFVVESAPDGTDAVAMVEKAEENYYDVVLMDVQMPIMNGYEATRTIRNMPRKDVKTLPIIAMTANALEEDKEAALKNGMNAHISKPLNMDIFISVLKQFVK